MNKLSFLNKQFFHRAIRFGINGFIIMIGTYILIQAFLFIGIGYVFASTLGYIVMVFVNYLVSAKFVFKTKRSWKNLLHYLLSQGLAFLLFTLINYVLYSSELDKNYCFFIAIALSTIINFLYNNFITFRK